MANPETRFQPTSFTASLRSHMEAWCDEVGKHPPMLATWTDGIYSDYHTLAKRPVCANSVKLHKYAAHILSSQAFAFNLFLPFREGSRELLSKRISELVGDRLTIDKVRFEWVPPSELLSELDGQWPVGDEPAT